MVTMARCEIRLENPELHIPSKLKSKSWRRVPERVMRARGDSFHRRFSYRGRSVRQSHWAGKCGALSAGHAFDVRIPLYAVL